MGDAEFPETRWSLIRAARTEVEGLGAWCERYATPAREYLGALGCPADEAEDLVQDFIHRLIRRGPAAGLPEQLDGSFRAYLKRSLRNFLVDRRRAAAAERRGGGRASLDVTEMELPDAAEAPDVVFDRAWVMRLMELATERLRREFEGGGREEFFEAVAPLLDGRRGPPGLAGRFGMSEAAFRAALYRLRKRYRALIEAELRETVGDGGSFEVEMRHLMAVWS